MVFKICDRCKGINIKTLVPKLKKIENAGIKIGCQNLCGIGRSKPFVIVDYIPIIADSEDELIEKVREHIKK